MRTERSKLVRFIYGAFAAWGVLFLVVFGFGTSTTFQVIRGFWPLLTILIAPVFGILSLVALVKERRKVYPLAVLLLAVIALWAFKRTFGYGAWINFQLHKGGYESVVKRVLAARDDEDRKRLCDKRCTVYHEDVVSLSFPYAEGFLSWAQIIYDPVGIPRPRKLGNFHPNPPYDVYLVRAEPLAKDWYLCYFID